MKKAIELEITTGIQVPPKNDTGVFVAVDVCPGCKRVVRAYDDDMYLLCYPCPICGTLWRDRDKASGKWDSEKKSWLIRPPVDSGPSQDKRQ